MSKILVAYVLSLLGYPVWTGPAAGADVEAPAVAAPLAAPEAEPAPPPAPRVVPVKVVVETPAEEVEVEPGKPEAPEPVVEAPAAPVAAEPEKLLPEGDPEGSAEDVEAPAADAVPAADEIVARVQAVYDETTTFQANFRQVFRHRLNPDRSKEATGVVYLEKPGRMRWEYRDPERKLIVSDGTTLWAYEPEEDQVFEQSLADTDLPTAVTFLLGSGSLTDEFDARLVEQQADEALWVIELRPRVASSHYSRLLLVVKRTDYHVARTVVVDHSGNTNSIEFAGEILNGDIPASKFRFVRPEGARVIR